MTRTVTLRELVESMSKSKDDEVFRWHQCSVVGPDGVPQATETLRVTMGQARRELGIS